MLQRSGRNAGLSRNLRGGLLFWLGLLMLVASTSFWITPAMAGGCGPFNITVAHSDSFAIDASNCGNEGGFSFGLDPIVPGVNPSTPSHGTAVQTSFIEVVYTHNGDSATSDDFTITDAVHDVIPVHVTILPAASSIVIGPSSVPTPVVGVALSQTFTASGGVAPYTWSVSGGGLPPGLTLSAAGVLSGTPTGAGPYSFSVRATDSTAPTAEISNKGYSVTIADPVLVVTPTNPPDGAIGQPYSQQFSTSGGISPYDYRVEVNVQDGLPPGLSMSSSGLLSGTPTTSGTWVYSLISDDVSTNSGGGNFFVVQLQTIVILAAPPPPVAGAVSAAVAYGSSASPITLALSGGTATSVAIATSASHGTATASGISISYTPTAGYFGTDTFTYTATNAGGTSSPATVSITVSAPPAPVAADASAAVPYETAQAIDLSASITGVHASIAVVSGPAHGTIGIAGDVVTYTPTAGYFGSDAFTYTATGPGGTSAPATVTLTVATPGAPVAADASAAVPYETAQAIDLSASITGVHASIAVVSGPAHGTIGIAGDVVTYTPTAGYFGGDAFTYTATGPGGTSAPATITLTVATPGAPVAADASAAVPYETAQTIDLSASITGLHASIAVASGPAHGTIGIAGDVVTYTPTAGYFGADSFTYTATGPGGTSAPATVTLTVATPGAPVVFDASASVAHNTAKAIDLSASITGVHTSIAVVTGPAHGTTSVTGDVVTYTPTTGYFGGDNFTYTATGPGGTSVIATVTLAIAAAPSVVFTPAPGALPDAMAGEHYSEIFSVPGGSAYTVSGGALPLDLNLNATGHLDGKVAAASAGVYNFTITATVGNAPMSASYDLTVNASQVTAQDKVVSFPPGSTPLPVDLTEGATGGPFSGAVVGTVTPPQAGTAEITMGDVASIDTVWSHKFYLKFHPNPAYQGKALVGYTLIGAGGSSSATVTFFASLDANGVANNFDHLLKDFVQARGSLLANGIETPGLRQRRGMSSGTSPGVVNISPSDGSVTMNFATSLAELHSWGKAGDAAGALAQSDPAEEPFNFWIDGTATLHFRSDEGDDHWGRFALISVGGDYLINDKLLVGLALHADFMDDIATDSTIEGTGILVGPYVSAEIIDGVFLDASIYYGRSWNEVTTSIFGGSFQTGRLLAKAGLEGEWALSEALTLRPKVKAFYLHETTDQYTVTDGLGSAITTAGFTNDELRLSAGGTLEYVMDLGEGLSITPNIGVQLGVSLTPHDPAVLFTTLWTGFDLSGLGNWTLGGAIEADLESDSLRAVSAKASLSGGF